MFHPASLSKSASLLISAIAGSLLVASFLPTSASSIESQAMQLTDRPTASETAEVNRVAVLAIAVGGSAAIGLGLSATLDRKRSQSSTRLLPRTSQPRSSTVSFDQASRPLRQKLIRLLHEDQGAATRLFAQASLKHPGKAPNWYVEKVIYDLERDRGR